MRKYFLTFLLFIFASPIVAENVTNVRVQQEGKTVVITYDLNHPADIRLLITHDNLNNYEELKRTKGDVGDGITAGRNRIIIWEPLEEYGKFIAKQVRFKVDVINQSKYKFVDLGLSVKWATCNIGAESPEDYGHCFAWGETTVKSSYLWSNYKYYNETYSDSIKKYYESEDKTNYNQYIYIDEKVSKWSEAEKAKFMKNHRKAIYWRSQVSGMTKEEAQKELKIQQVIDKNKLFILQNGFEDAATYNWGGTCRMPTIGEWIELAQKCTWNLKQGGYEVIGPNGNSIFLPIRVFSVHYWSSTQYTSLPGRAWSFYYEVNCRYKSFEDRYKGLYVRPVCP